MQRGLLVRFLVSALVGALVAIGLGVITAGPQLQSTAKTGDPVSITTAGGAPLDFGLVQAQPAPIPALPVTSTIQLTSFHAAASSDPGGGIEEPWWRSSIPRIPSITQFDGGPLQRVNCLMAAGAMLARLGYGVVTTGSQVRALSGDTDGGTNYGNLQDAVKQGWNLRFFQGALTPLQLRALLYAGAGAVIDGNYGALPVSVRVQKNFTGNHAVYVDAFRPKGPDGEAAYWVMDPIGHGGGYKGGWWPANDVERFAGQLAGGRINTLWAFPGGTVPTNHPILPPEGYPDGSSGPGPSLAPGESPAPGQSLAPGETLGPPIETRGPIVDPMPTGDEPLEDDPDVGEPTGGDPKFPEWHFEDHAWEILDPPEDDRCAATRLPIGCPRGIVGITNLTGLKTPATAPPTHEIKLLYADAIAPDTYQVIYEPHTGETSSRLLFWGGTGDIVQEATVEEGVLDGREVSIATITLEPGRTYSFMATSASSDERALSDVGRLTVGE
jgi:hypothetical protein